MSASLAESKDLLAVIGQDEANPIPFSGRLFASHSNKFQKSGQKEGKVSFDSRFQRDSVIQFLAVCQNEKPQLTASNVFEVDLLCREWEVDSSVQDQIKSFIENPPAGTSLLVSQLLFSLAHELPTAEVEAALSQNLVKSVEDPQLLEVPVSIFVRIVNFSTYEEDSQSFDRLFSFCLRYYEKHGSTSSQIFQTLKISKLTKSNLESLCLLQDFQWGFVNESIGQTLIELIEFNRCLLLRSKSLEEVKLLRQEQERQRNEYEQAIAEIKEELLKQQDEEQQKQAELHRIVIEQRNKIAIQARSIDRLQSRLNGLTPKLNTEMPNIADDVARLKQEVREIPAISSPPVSVTASKSPVPVTPSPPVSVTPSPPVSVTPSKPPVSATPSPPVSVTPSPPVSVTPSKPPVLVAPSKPPVLVAPSKSPVPVAPSKQPVPVTPSPSVSTSPSPNRKFVPSDLALKANDWKATKEDDMAPRVPLNGVIAYLTKKYGGNVHDRDVVVVTSSKPDGDDPEFSARSLVELNDGSIFASTYREKWDDIPHTRNNWVCYDFKNRKVVPTHYAIRSYGWGEGGENPKNWLVETSLDGETWVEIDHREDCSALEGESVTRIFEVSRSEECRFIRLVNVGRNWFGSDQLEISAWEIYGTLIETEAA